MKEDECVRANQSARRFSDCGEDIAAVQRLDEVRDDLAVSFRLEGVALRFELGAQLPVILNISVVDDSKLAGAIVVRVCVWATDRSDRCPSSVADAYGALDVVKLCCALVYCADAFPGLDALSVENRNAERVVSAVGDQAKGIQQDREGFSIADVSNDSTHLFFLSDCGPQARFGLDGRLGVHDRPSSPSVCLSGHGLSLALST